MNLGSRGPVVIDTGGVRRPTDNERAVYPPRCASRCFEGRPAVISLSPLRSLGYGARLADWGPDRLRRLDYEVGRAEIV